MFKRIQKIIAATRDRAFEPVDIASIAIFRIAFGILMAYHVWTFFTDDRIATWWLEPRLLFKYYGFSWVHPWPGNGLYIHRHALGIFAILLGAGVLYRLSTALFFLSYSYFFLLDEIRYQNHQYLICLLSFLLIFIPAHRAWSVDTIVRPKLRGTTVPALALWIFRAQIAFVYFYGGIAKLNPDWLRGEPMRRYLAQAQDFPILGQFFTREWMVYLISYGGLLFDLCIGPLLLWRRTRIPAFCAAVLFHLSNQQIFKIDIFPWLAIALTTLFFSPDWPRRVISIFRRRRPDAPAETQPASLSQRKRDIVFSLAAAYLTIQFIVPLRPFVFYSGSEWAMMQHRFCWRMLLRHQSARGYFYVTDPNVGRTNRLAPRDFITPAQTARLSWYPDMVIQAAHYLARTVPRSGPRPLQVEARLFVSINGRRPELFADPTVNLAAETRSLMRPRWLRPIREPLPPPGQNLSHDAFGSPF